jgi:hypothetical protein
MNQRRVVARVPTSSVHVDGVRRVTGGDRRGGGGGGGREREDWAGHERADGTDGEDGGSDDVAPNSHVYLYAFAEVKCLRPGFGGPPGRLCPFTSLWLIT